MMIVTLVTLEGHTYYEDFAVVRVPLECCSSEGETSLLWRCIHQRSYRKHQSKLQLPIDKILT